MIIHLIHCVVVISATIDSSYSYNEVSNVKLFSHVLARKNSIKPCSLKRTWNGVLSIVCIALAIAKGTTSIEPAGGAEKANTARLEALGPRIYCMARQGWGRGESRDTVVQF